jgi:hypothetical protein
MTKTHSCTNSDHDGSIVERRSHVLRRLATAAVAIPIALATVGAAPVLASSTPHAAAINYSGPATATLKIAGKTYSFKNGQCLSIKVSSIVVDVTLGTVADGTGQKLNSGNLGKAYFSLDLSKGFESQILTAADFGGKTLVKSSPVAATTFTSSASSKGTFKSAKNPLYPNQKPFSGSWNCHGSFAKH